MSYTPRQTLAATEFMLRLSSLHVLSDRDPRRPSREDDAKIATYAFFDLFNISHDTPASIMLALARWITNPEAHVYVPNAADGAGSRCIVGRTVHHRCGRSRYDPRHISPVTPPPLDLSDLGAPVLVDVTVTETDEGLRFEGRRP